jgi:hypothetical protein
VLFDQNGGNPVEYDQQTMMTYFSTLFDAWFWIWLLIAIFGGAFAGSKYDSWREARKEASPPAYRIAGTLFVIALFGAFLTAWYLYDTLVDITIPGVLMAYITIIATKILGLSWIGIWAFSCGSERRIVDAFKLLRDPTVDIYTRKKISPPKKQW